MLENFYPTVKFYRKMVIEIWARKRFCRGYKWNKKYNKTSFNLLLTCNHPAIKHLENILSRVSSPMHADRDGKSNLVRHTLLYCVETDAHNIVQLIPRSGKCYIAGALRTWGAQVEQESSL